MEENNVLADYQGKLLSNKNVLDQVMNGYKNISVISGAMKDINMLYSDKLSTARPQIMMYGIYNAGKSSIINELIGDDKAEVADKPETMKVTSYKWRSYEIADTPGVAAPIKDEEVTHEHLKKADIVVFVISTTGSFDYDEVYTRMKDISDSGKRIIIVLNDKSGAMGSKDPSKMADIEAIKQKVGHNLRQKGLDNKDFTMVVVNAKRARTGRLNNKPKLVELSNMSELETVIWNELKKTSTMEVIYRTVDDILKNVNTILATMESNVTEGNAQVINTLIRELTGKNKEIRNDLHNRIDERMTRLAKELPDDMWKLRENSSEVEKVINDKIKNVVEKVQSDLEIAIGDLNDEIYNEINDLCDKMQAKNIDNNLLDEHSKKLMLELENLCRTYELNGDFSVISEVSFMEEAGNIAKDIAATGTGKMAMKYAGEKIGEVVGRKAIEKAVISTAAKVVGKKVAASLVAKAIPVVNVVSIVYDVYSVVSGYFNRQAERARQEAEAANARAQAKLEAEKQMREEIAQKCQYIAEDLSDSIKIDISKTLHDQINTIRQRLGEISKNISSNEAASTSDIEKVRDIINNYESVKVALKSSIA